jgi:uncharacterized protein YjbI with pentapeptide repeats
LFDEMSCETIQVEWELTDNQCKEAWAHRDDAPRDGAYSCALAATELSMALNELDTGIDLSRVQLTGADLTGASLIKSNLSCADLRNTNLTYAVLERANLSGANLNNSILSGAVLKNADFQSADLLDLENFALTRFLDAHNL